jgi:hypothetical protein
MPHRFYAMRPPHAQTRRSDSRRKATRHRYVHRSIYQVRLNCGPRCLPCYQSPHAYPQGRNYEFAMDRNHNDLRAFASVAPTGNIIRGMKVMRVLLGIIFGVFLTIGFAYVYDASTTQPSNPTAQTSVEQRPMVNWDVVSGNWQGLSSSVRNTWNKLAAR